MAAVLNTQYEVRERGCTSTVTSVPWENNLLSFPVEAWFSLEVYSVCLALHTVLDASVCLSVRKCAAFIFTSNEVGERSLNRSTFGNLEQFKSFWWRVTVRHKEETRFSWRKNKKKTAVNHSGGFFDWFLILILMLLTLPPLSTHLQGSSPVCVPACPCKGMHEWSEAWEAGNCCSSMCLVWLYLHWIINGPVECHRWQRRVDLLLPPSIHAHHTGRR